MKKRYLIVVFFILNFGALGIGTILMDNGPKSDWYTSLVKAPWTPAGWVFGAAWSSIMVCFSIYMTKLVKTEDGKLVIKLFAVQWVLNVLWNYLFFNQHLVLFAFIELLALTILVGYFLFRYSLTLKYYTLLIVPYFLWMLIASSLNGYILMNN
jgi:tryptophan-rich sensory protein